tara:strand:+ start:642 stop:1670 length:1029 start_codon:yes stop_codon:yes gene_type:complete
MFLEKKKYLKSSTYWLASLLIFLFIIVLIGGLTRLTDSGLSITRWEVVSGIFPPFTNESWNKAFDLYKEIPQYALVNQSISLSDFKIIYYWEYVHRLLGRVFGILFLLPFFFLFIKRVFSKEFNLKLLILFLLILFQGFIGWYMVKSGLVENISVSHFRLAIHLNIALILFAAIFWYFLNLKNSSNEYFFNFSKKNIFIKIFILLIFLQITFGAFTSGLDAGKIYQTWPSMNNNYFPNDINLENLLSLTAFSEPSAVQFFHRNLAYLIFLYTICISFYVFFYKKKYLYNSLLFLLSMVLIQILLGIFTLLSGLNIAYASLHQISTTLLLISSINFSYNLEKG